MSSIVLWPSNPASQIQLLIPPPPEPAQVPSPKAKHGAYKIWHRNVEPSLREAYNSVYGLSLYGSLAFASLRTATGFALIQTETRERFLGPATVSTTLRCGYSNSKIVKVTATSAGKDDGDFVSVLLDGVEVSCNQRGFNVVIINRATGQLHSSHAFDTHGSPSESVRLAAFINEMAANLEGHIIFGAIRDDGAKFLTGKARSAISRLGVQLPEADNAERLAKIIHLLPTHRCQVLLTVCAKANAARCARLLLEAGWPVSYRAAHTLNTPLHDAAYQCNTEVAEVLIAYGACQKTTNRWGESPNDIAATRHSFSCLDDMLLERSVPVQSIIEFLDL